MIMESMFMCAQDQYYQTMWSSQLLTVPEKKMGEIENISFFSDLILQSESYQSWETESSAARSCGEKD